MYCVVPKKLIKQRNITANAKLLYSVIVQQSSENECLRTNLWFAEIFGVKKLTVAKWLKELENAEYIKEILLSNDTVSTKFLNKKYIAYIVNQHLNNIKNHRLLIWSFLNFEWWCRIYLNKKNESD